MSKIDVFLHSTEDEEVLITRYNTIFIDPWERRTPIGAFYNAWKDAIKPGHSAPLHEDFAPRDNAILRFDTVAENPFNYMIHRDGDIPGFASLRMLSDTESKVIQRQLFGDLIGVRETQEPLYQSVEHRIFKDDGYEEMTFRRLMVPVLGENGKARYVYSAVREMGTPARVTLRIVDESELFHDL